MELASPDLPPHADSITSITRVKPVQVTWELTHIEVAFEYVAEGHLGRDHHEKLTLDGVGEAIFLPQNRISFEVCGAKVNRNGDSAVAAPDSEVPRH